MREQLYVAGIDDSRIFMPNFAEPRPIDNYMSHARRDFSRIVYSPSFRRLQGKTQLFPTSENHPFYRNRLTHSIEVSNICSTIAAYLNRTSDALKELKWKIDFDIVALAGLAHDLGHPPFGHTGEKALNECMKSNQCGGFEGNAQTLRIVTKLEQRISLFHDVNDFFGTDDFHRNNTGLNLTYRSIASIIKYDKTVGSTSRKLPEIDESKGYYPEEEDLVNKIRENILRGKYTSGQDPRLYTLECQILDIADDIAYSTFDLEDCLCADFINPMDFLSRLNGDEMANIVRHVNNGMKKRGIEETFDEVHIYACLFDIFRNLFAPSSDLGIDTAFERGVLSSLIYDRSIELQQKSYIRRDFSLKRIQQLLQSIDVIPDEKEPALSQITIDPLALLEIECLKAMNYEMVINSQQLKMAEFKGRRIVKELFNSIMEKKSLLPSDILLRAKIEAETMNHSQEQSEARAVCDFIAGMTDNYATQFYSQLTGQDHSSLLALRPYS